MFRPVLVQRSSGLRAAVLLTTQPADRGYIYRAASKRWTSFLPLLGTIVTEGGDFTTRDDAEQIAVKMLAAVRRGERVGNGGFSIERRKGGR